MKNMKISVRSGRSEPQINKRLLARRYSMPQDLEWGRCLCHIPDQTVWIMKGEKWRSKLVFLFRYFLFLAWDLLGKNMYFEKKKLFFRVENKNFLLFFFSSSPTFLTSITIEDCTSVLLYSQPLSQCCRGQDSFGSSESISVFWRIIFQSTAYRRHLSYTCSPFFCRREIREKKIYWNWNRIQFSLFLRNGPS